MIESGRQDPEIEQFLEHLRVERNYSPHTLRNYRSDLKAFFNGTQDGDFRRL
jgi:site-specific recombinase XerC